MNKISAELFLDLIADPAKYRTYLTRLEEERSRLNETIETIGKATELDKLRKAVEKQALDNEQDLVEKHKALEQLTEHRLSIIASAQTSADEALEQATKATQEANQLKEEAARLAKSFEGRDKSLRQSEETVRLQQAQVSQMIVEYEERLSKLRSVMA